MAGEPTAKVLYAHGQARGEEAHCKIVRPGVAECDALNGRIVVYHYPPGQPDRTYRRDTRPGSRLKVKFSAESVRWWEEPFGY